MATRGVFTFVLLTACAAERDTREPAPSQPSVDRGVQLVDSFVPPQVGADAALWNVRFGPDTATPIPNVLVAYAPTLVGDTSVVGIRFDSSGALRDLFRYDVRTHATRFDSLPRELRQDFSEIAINPHGDAAVSLYIDNGGKARAQVFELGKERPWAISVAVTPPATDGRFAHAFWTGDSAHVDLPLASGEPIRFTLPPASFTWLAAAPHDTLNPKPRRQLSGAEQDSAFGITHATSFFEVTGPTLLTSFPISAAELDASEHAGDAKDRYDGYIEKAARALKTAGVAIRQTNDPELRWRDSTGPHSLGMGTEWAALYLFVTPDGKTKLLRGAILGDSVILDAARKHFGIVIPDR